MIYLTRLNGKQFVLNADLIETVESTPDTVVALISGKKYVVAEAVETLINKVVEYRRQINFVSLEGSDPDA